MADLKRCPFCGSDKVEARYLYFRPYIICEKCHAQIPCYNTYQGAREAWNRRADNCDRWISVKEILPLQSKRWENYIVTVVRSHWPTSTYDVCDAPYDEVFVTTAQYDSEQKIWHLVVWEEQINALLGDESAPVNGDVVTHWMPLPEPPKGEDNG